MTTNIKLEVTLTPVGTPWISIRAPGFDKSTQLLIPTTFNIEINTDSQEATLEIEHLHKLPSDPTTAVIVDNIAFFGINDPKFAWAGVYYPVYPEPWASEQVSLAQEISGQTYLGWNGTYQLTFGVPVFTWIHQVQNLGWIYQ